MNVSTTGGTAEVLRDRRGKALFICPHCSGELTDEDVISQGLRLPSHDETRDEYCEAELVDDLEHLACARGQQAG